ncbi:ATP-binding cassette domain-containing protein, partial [Proteus terrae]
LDIDHGEFCTFVGPSGCGKTTILRMINQLDIPDSGDVYIQGVRLADADIIQIRRQIGFVMQSAALFPHRTVAQNIATVPRLAGWSKARIRARIDELVALMSLDSHLLHRYPHQLSGGQRQRVAIARALILEPQVLLLDEPTSALDVSVQAEILNLLAELQREAKLTYLMVTHDLGVIAHLCQKVAVMQYGKILETLTVDALVSGEARTAYTQMLVNASRQYTREMAREVADY